METCPLCKKQVEVLIPRFVGIKKRSLNICEPCDESTVTYKHDTFILDGDTVIINSDD